MQGRLDISRQVLDVCRQHGAKPSLMTINSVMNSVQRTPAMPPAEKVQVGLELVDLINGLGMQVMLILIVKMPACASATHPPTSPITPLQIMLG